MKIGEYSNINQRVKWLYFQPFTTFSADW
jgi:hypothetical protein